MTTGRINQVTILNATASAGRETPLGGAEQFAERGGTPAGRDPVASYAGLPAIHLPPLSFPRRCPPHGGQGLGPVAECGIGPSRGGYRPQSTSRGTDDCLGLPPSV